MGMDIQMVIHYGPPSDYLQEVARVGRDSLPSNVILYNYPGYTVRSISPAVEKVLVNTGVCQHAVLLEYFQEHMMMFSFNSIIAVVFAFLIRPVQKTKQIQRCATPEVQNYSRKTDR